LLPFETKNTRLRDRNRALTWTGVAGFEPAASSSPKPSCHTDCQGCGVSDLGATAIGIRWRPPLAVAIVTHVVTRLHMTPPDQPWLSGHLAAHRVLREVIGTAFGTSLELSGRLERRRARLHRPCQVKSVGARVNRPEPPPRGRSGYPPGVTAFGTCSVICVDLPREAHGVILDAGLCLVKKPRTPGLLDANYRYGPSRSQTAQRGAEVDVCPERPFRAWVAVRSCCTAAHLSTGS